MPTARQVRRRNRSHRKQLRIRADLADYYRVVAARTHCIAMWCGPGESAVHQTEGTLIEGVVQVQGRFPTTSSPSLK